MSCEKPQLLSNKHPAATVTVAFEFRGLTDTPSSPAVTATYYSGEVDASPGNIRSGSPQISGSDVLQRITAGVDGCTYLLEATASGPDGNVYVRTALLHVCAPSA